MDGFPVHNCSRLEPRHGLGFGNALYSLLMHLCCLADRVGVDSIKLTDGWYCSLQVEHSIRAVHSKAFLTTPCSTIRDCDNYDWYSTLFQ